MNDYNEAIIIGRATDNITSVKQPDGVIRYSFVVALNYYSYKTTKAYSEFIPVCFWKPEPFKELASLNKGDTVFVNGRISIRSYEKNNQKKWMTEIIGRYVRVFKLNKEARDINDLLDLIKSNKSLLDEITASDHIQLSDDLSAELDQSAT